MKKQAPEVRCLTLEGDYLVGKVAMDDFLKSVDTVIAHLVAGSSLDPEDGAAIDLMKAREAFRYTAGL